MNVLFFQDSLGVSGPEVWLVDTVDRLIVQGHQVFIACPAGSWVADQAEARGIPFFDYVIEEAFEDHLLWQLVEHLKQWQIDLVFCSVPGTRIEVPILDAAIREVGRGGIVLRVGIMPVGDMFTSERLGVQYSTVQGIVAVSEGIRDALYERFSADALAPVHVLYNGVDLERFCTDKRVEVNDVRARFGIPLTGSAVVAVGRLDAIKNIKLLVRAAPRVLERFPDTTFVIAGEGAEIGALVELAESEGVLERFCFTGFVDDVPAMLQATDVLVHAAFMEGLPNAVLEAMAMAKPIVASRVSGVVELIDDGEHGVLFASDDVDTLVDALCRVLADDGLQLALGKGARQRVESAFDRRERQVAFAGFLHDEAKRVKTYVPDKVPVMGDLPRTFFPASCRFRGVPR